MSAKNHSNNSSSAKSSSEKNSSEKSGLEKSSSKTDNLEKNISTTGVNAPGVNAVDVKATSEKVTDAEFSNNNHSAMAVSPEQLNRDQKTADGSPVCANCGASLQGRFCHQCGQNSRSLIKFFGSVITDLLDDIVGYDSRLKHSLIPLLFKPGKLTKEYIHGRRFYYVLPFRLYLFCSVFFILGLQLVTDPKDINVQNNLTAEEKAKAKEEIIQQLEASGEEMPPQLMRVLEQLDDKSADNPNSKKIEQPQDDSDITTDKAKSLTPSTTSQKLVDGKELNEQVNKKIEKTGKGFNITFDDSGLEAKGMEDIPVIKNYVATINKKYKNWANDPGPLIDEFFRLFPYMMFILLPVFAMLMKLLYAFSRRYYVEHLVFVLHNHSFVFLSILIMIGTSAFGDYLGNSDSSLASTIAGSTEIINTILGIWIVVYIVLSLKRVYQQNWWMTIGKTFLLSQLYFAILGAGLVVVILLGAYWA